MSDVKVEYEQQISRDEAAVLLSQLARAFTGDGDAEFPFGPGTVKLDVPRTVRAELEVEVEDDEVQVEIEFKWALPQRPRQSGP
jgi:amphi-Trp domain-containing protein